MPGGLCGQWEGGGAVQGQGPGLIPRGPQSGREDSEGVSLRVSECPSGRDGCQGQWGFGGQVGQAVLEVTGGDKVPLFLPILLLDSNSVLHETPQATPT